MQNLNRMKILMEWKCKYEKLFHQIFIKENNIFNLKVNIYADIDSK